MSHLSRARYGIRVLTSSIALYAIAPLSFSSPSSLPTPPAEPDDKVPTVDNAMYRSTCLLLFAAVAIINLVTSSPIAVPHTQRRQIVNCTDPNAITSGSCWEGLHLDEYLTNWNKNKPICTTDYGTLQDGANCCAPNEVWSTCFIRLAMGNHGYNCININEGTCPSFQVESSTAPEVRYLLATMYSEFPIEPA